MKTIMTRLAIFALVLVAGIASLSAQIYAENFRYRAEAGVTASKITKWGIGENLYGLRISGQVLMPFENSKWGLVTGLTLTNKGEKSSFYQNTKVGKVTVTPQEKTALMYLQLPVNFSHRFDFNENNRLYFEFGPYVAYALSGKLGAVNLLEKVNGESPFNRFEVGLGASVHYDYKNMYLKVGAEYSLTRVVNQSGSLVGHSVGTPRYGLGYVTLGYQF